MSNSTVREWRPPARIPLAVQWRRVRRRRNLVVGFILTVLVVGAALTAPVLPIPDPTAVDLDRRLAPPSAAAPLGTDQFGRDLLARVVWGARTSLLIGVASVAVGSVVGTAVGTVAAYFKGITETALMGIVDMLLALPTILLAMILAALAGPGMGTLIIAIGFATMPTFARIARSAAITVMNQEYVDAARVVGATHVRIVLRHVLPNMAAPLVVLFSLRVAEATLVEASLSFLGIGVQPPTPAWGTMVSEGLPFLQTAPWISIVPSVAVSMMVLGFNLLGDGLRDLLDPRISRSA
jgi:peptide/nickel transport system permease protein